VPRPLLTKWCLDDTPAASPRESARSSSADVAGDDGGFVTSNIGSASGRAISLIPLTEDLTENFVVTTGGSDDVALSSDQLTSLRLEVNDNAVVAEETKPQQLVEEEGSTILLDTGDVSLGRPNFATQQFEDFVDFSSF
jgi:hypothetical protein